MGIGNTIVSSGNKLLGTMANFESGDLHA
jgi:hypothetical protein